MKAARHAARMIPSLVSGLLRLRHPPGLPPAVQIEPTNYCNLDCPACHPRALPADRRDNRHLAVPELRRILEQIRPVSVELTGVGEPMMNPDFFRLLSLAKDTGAAVSTFSNMTLMDEEKASQLVDAAPHVFRISMDAATSATYRAVRGRDLFDAVCNGIRILRRVRDERTTRLPEIVTCFLLQEGNLHETAAFVKLAAGLGVERVHFQLPDTTGIFIREMDILGSRRPEEFRDAILEGGHEGSRVGVETDAGSCAGHLWPPWARILYPEGTPSSRGSHPGSAPAPGTCMYPWLSAYITVDGSVRPCCMAWPDFGDEIIMGNVLRDPFRKIWNGNRYARFREMTASGDRPLACRQCTGRTLGMLAGNSNIGRILAKVFGR